MVRRKVFVERRERGRERETDRHRQTEGETKNIVRIAGL